MFGRYDLKYVFNFETMSHVQIQYAPATVAITHMRNAYSPVPMKYFTVTRRERSRSAQTNRKNVRMR